MSVPHDQPAIPALELPLGVLDLCKRAGGSASASLEATLALAQRAEMSGYRRYWIAEHHVEDASHSCPEILIPLIATSTSRIRVGSGALLLRYYSSLKVAEVFLALEALFPGRIDLGIAKGPGLTDPEIAKALVSGNIWELHDNAFERKTLDLTLILQRATASAEVHGIRATPRSVCAPPVWVLGSGPGSCRLASRLRLPYSLSIFLGGPAMNSVQLINDYQQSVGLALGDSGLTTSIAVSVVCDEKAATASRRNAQLVKDGRFAANVVGTPESCVRRLAQIKMEHKVDEIIITTFTDDWMERQWLYAAIGETWRSCIGE